MNLRTSVVLPVETVLVPIIQGTGPLNVGCFLARIHVI